MARWGHGYDDDETTQRTVRESQLTSSFDASPLQAAGQDTPDAMPASVGDPILGQFIHNLQVIACLGRGGFGSVYLAEHTELQTPFAIKLLDSLQADNPDSVERFRREARAIAQMRHPHVVQVTDFGWWEGFGYYLVMEYLEGASLLEVLKQWPWAKAPFPVSRTRRIFETLCDALQHVHQAGIVHRDLKPANIVMAQDSMGRETLKLIDFGIASLSDDVSLTETGMCVGSPAFMSPEQARGEKELISGRSDLYTCGIILYQMLTGRMPFHGKGLASYIRLHTEEPPPSLQSASPYRAWAPRLEGCMRQFLAKKPEDRPHDAMVFWKMLDAALQDQEEMDGDTVMEGQNSPLAALAPEAPAAFAAEGMLSTVQLRSDPNSTTQKPLPTPDPPAPRADHKKMLWVLGVLFVLICFFAGIVATLWLLQPPRRPATQLPRPAPLSLGVTYVIDSQPKAQIYVGGQLAGTTPFRGQGVPGQMLLFTLAKKGFLPRKVRWRLGSNSRQMRSFPLTKISNNPRP